MADAVTDPAVLSAFGMGGPQPAADPNQAQSPGGPITDPAVIDAFNKSAQAAAPTPDVPVNQGWGDWLKGAGNAAVHGANATLGMVGNWGDAAESTASKAIVYGADKLGLLPNGKHYSDFVDAMQNDKALNAPPQGVLANIEASTMPTSQGLMNAENNIAGQNLPAPQTPGGQFIDRTGSFLPMAATMGLGGGAAAMTRSLVANGAAPALGSEAGGYVGNLVGGQTGGAIGSFIGAGAGGMAGGSVAGSEPMDHLLSGASRGASDAQIQQAQSLMQSAQRMGIQLTPAEAIQHVTGGATGLGALQRHAESLGESRPIMSQFMAQRPGQVDQAARGVFDQISPPIANPDVVAVQAAGEANGALSQVRQDRSAQTGALYTAAGSGSVPSSEIEALANRLTQQAGQNATNPDLANPLLRIRDSLMSDPGSPGSPGTPGTPPGRVAVTDPATGAFIRWQPTPGTPGTPPTPPTPPTYVTNVGQLGNLYKTWRDTYGGPIPLGASGADATAIRNANGGIQDLGNAIRQNSPEWRTANDLHRQITAQEVTPREQGTIGQISRQTDLGQMGQTLYPSNPNLGQAAVTADAVRRMPNTAPAITRNHLETAFNEATQNNIAGPNQWGGAKFAAQIAGNPGQQANLQAGLSAMPNGAALSPRAAALVEALQATGQRERPGSMTAYNTHDIEGLEKGGKLGHAAALAASPMEGLGKLAIDTYQRYRIGQNAEALARALTGGDEGMQSIMAARQAIPPEQYRSMLAAALMQRATMPATVSLGVSGRQSEDQ